jgi:hypothetical protein
MIEVVDLSQSNESNAMKAIRLSRETRDLLKVELQEHMEVMATSIMPLASVLEGILTDAACHEWTREESSEGLREFTTLECLTHELKEILWCYVAALAFASSSDPNTSPSSLGDSVQ